MTHTVLVVEDEEELREMLRDALERNGYTVAVASDGQEALDALERIDHVCVVLLDLVMPGMNGWDFFERFQTRPEWAKVPVVVHSSATSNAPQGVARVVRKPLELRALLALVREYCAADR